jgi:hypothetical protein
MGFFDKLRKKIRKTTGQKEPFTRPKGSWEGKGDYTDENVKQMADEANEAMKALKKDKEFQKKKKEHYKLFGKK